MAQFAGYGRWRSHHADGSARLGRLSPAGRLLRRRRTQLAVGGCDHPSTNQGREIVGRFLQTVSWRAERPADGEDLHLRRRGERAEPGRALRLARLLDGAVVEPWTGRPAWRSRSERMESRLRRESFRTGSRRRSWRKIAQRALLGGNVGRDRWGDSGYDRGDGCRQGRDGAGD